MKFSRVCKGLPKQRTFLVCNSESSSGFSAEHYDGIFTTIGVALQAAADDDVIDVAAGIYEEGVELRKAVTLRARGDGAVTVINTGNATLASTAVGARVVNIQFEHRGGDASSRGRAGPRCLEVLSGELTVEGCGFKSEVGSAVMSADGGSVILRRCRLHDCGRCGIICVLGGRAECNKCELVGNALNGADIQSGGMVRLMNNSISRNQQTGVLVADALSFVHVEGNEIAGNGRRGVTAQKSGSFFLKANKVIGNSNIGVIGIGPWEHPNALTICNNEISANQAAGLWVQRGDAEIVNNEVCRNADSGIVAFGSSSVLKIRGNTVRGNQGAGISIHTAKFVEINGNRVGVVQRLLPTEHKVAFLMGLHPRLGKGRPLAALNEAIFWEVLNHWRDDEASGNQGAGIELIGTKCRVHGNRIEHNAEGGLVVCEGSQAEVLANSVASNQGAGVVVRGHNTRCCTRQNDIASNGQSGMDLSSGGFWVGLGGDRISQNLGDGVKVHGSVPASLLSGLAIRSNRGDGVSIDASSSVELDNCSILRNARCGLRLAGRASLCAASCLGLEGNEVPMVIVDGGELQRVAQDEPSAAAAAAASNGTQNGASKGTSNGGSSGASTAAPSSATASAATSAGAAASGAGPGGGGGGERRRSQQGQVAAAPAIVVAMS